MHNREASPFDPLVTLYFFVKRGFLFATSPKRGLGRGMTKMLDKTVL